MGAAAAAAGADAADGDTSGNGASAAGMLVAEAPGAALGAEALAPGVVGSNTGAELLAGAVELAMGIAPAGRVTPSSAL